ncbi:hypothetical protein Pmani_021362 [Petrolisthes manimaculis]|uniref:Uncharacterized protein n=1 Tax=Petrolisthes manimaculis TaxID=1843537 RepID=A0AAE1PEB6_9EUCA|nr:hypothetical protein Pmani_021362 [Petrolisthes manimaculis]
MAPILQKGKVRALPTSTFPGEEEAREALKVRESRGALYQAETHLHTTYSTSTNNQTNSLTPSYNNNNNNTSLKPP